MAKKSPSKKSRWHDPIVFYILFPILTLIIRSLLFSYRLVRIEGAELEKETLEKSGGKAVYCTWHQRLVFHPRYLSKKKVTVMVSQSRDGEFAARLINALGLGDVRGSSTRGGMAALVKLTQKIIAGEIKVVDIPTAVELHKYLKKVFPR